MRTRCTAAPRAVRGGRVVLLTLPSVLFLLAGAACGPAGRGSTGTLARDEASEPAGPGRPPESAPFQGTLAPVEWPRPDVEMATLKAVRTGVQNGYDRVVFEFGGGRRPGYQVAWATGPVLACGSGEPVEVAGQVWLEVRLTPARAHGESGDPTVIARPAVEGFPNLRALEQACDFEGHVEWVMGADKTRPFRVLELDNPSRLVLDILH